MKDLLIFLGGVIFFFLIIQVSKIYIGNASYLLAILIALVLNALLK